MTNLLNEELRQMIISYSYKNAHKVAGLCAENWKRIQSIKWNTIRRAESCKPRTLKKTEDPVIEEWCSKVEEEKNWRDLGILGEITWNK